jgi:hypothetical protein
MVMIDDFIGKLMRGKGTKENHIDFVKYYNENFEIFVFDKKVIVKDKRFQNKTIIYNSIHIAKANIHGITI